MSQQEEEKDILKDVNLTNSEEAPAKWYVLYVSASSEAFVKDFILERARVENVTDSFEEIIIPSIEYDTLKRGKQVTVVKKVLPGYILMKMKMNEQTIRIIKSVPKATNFLGSGNHPSAISQTEVDKMLRKINSGAKVAKINYEIGELVRIIDGPFNSFSGLVDEIDMEKEKIKVSVSIFGRNTVIELNFDQIEKS